MRVEVLMVLKASCVEALDRSSEWISDWGSNGVFDSRRSFVF